MSSASRRVINVRRRRGQRQRGDDCRQMVKTALKGRPHVSFIDPTSPERNRDPSAFTNAAKLSLDHCAAEDSDRVLASDPNDAARLLEARGIEASVIET